MGHRILSVIVALLLALAGGCKQSTAPVGSASPDSDTVARVHWLGKDRLATETNAAVFMRFWKTPESGRLESVTLDKLSRAPWRLIYGDASATNAANALLRPILSDLVQSESYAEVRQATNRQAEAVLAIRLDNQRAQLWDTNLAAVLESLTGSKPVPIASGSWQIALTNQLFAATAGPSTFRFSRAAEWTLLSLGPDRNPLLDDFAGRISRDHAPFGARATNSWMEADLDLRRLSKITSYHSTLLDDFPKVSATVTGDGENVRIRAELALHTPISATVQPWSIPTNLIQSPLMSLTAIRDLAPVLGKSQLFSGFAPDSMPDQLYLWDRAGPPLKMFFALRLRGSAGLFTAVADPIFNWINLRISPQRFGAVSIQTNDSKLIWSGLPLASPFLQAFTNSGQQYLFGGFGLHSFARTNPMPPELLSHILDATNMLYFDWEHTGEKIVHWRYFDDAAHIIFDAAHLSRFRDDSASLKWVIANSTNLSHSVTEVKLVDSNRLTFVRKATIGLTGLEIDFLANWLDLPQFPWGVGTILRTNSTPRPAKPKLNPGASTPPP